MTQQPDALRGPAVPSTASPTDAWLEPDGQREPALAPWWIPVGPGTPIDLPDLQDVWLDLWPAPKEPWRRRALGALVPTVVLVLVTALIVSPAAYAYRPNEPRDRTYVPVDGAFAQIDLNGVPGQLEQAAQNGTSVISLGVIGAAAAKTDLAGWAVDHDVWVAEAATGSGGASERLRVVLVVDRTSVSLLGVLTGTDVAAFQPALPVSRGSEGGQRTDRTNGTVTLPNRQSVPYAADTTVSGDGGCVSWSASITVTAVGAQPLDLSLRSCRDTGLQSFGFRRAGQTPVELQVTGTAPAAGRFDGSTQTPLLQQSAVAGWKPRAVALQSRDAAGASPLYPVVNRQPLVFGDHRFLLIGSDNALRAFAVDRGATSVWTAHPGGRISHLIAAGDLIIAATDQRRLIAYDVNGFRVWQHDLPDLVADITQTGDRLVLSVFTGVVMSIDVRTGSEQWRQELDSVRATPGIAASNEIVGLAEGDSTVHALDLSDGADQGDTGGADIGGLAVDGRSLILLRTDRLLRADTSPGGTTTLDIDTHTGIGAAMLVTGTIAVVRGDSEVVVVDLAAGAVVDRGPAAMAELASTPGAVLVLRAGAATVMTPASPTGTTFTTDRSGRSPDAGIGSWGAVVVYGEVVVVIA